MWRLGYNRRSACWPSLVRMCSVMRSMATMLSPLLVGQLVGWLVGWSVGLAQGQWLPVLLEHAPPGCLLPSWCGDGCRMPPRSSPTHRTPAQHLHRPSSTHAPQGMMTSACRRLGATNESNAGFTNLVYCGAGRDRSSTHV